MPTIDELLTWFDADIDAGSAEHQYIRQILVEEQARREYERGVRADLHRQEFIAFLQKYDPEGLLRAEFETYCGEHDL